MPRAKHKVRIRWRDAKAIRSHWGPFSFDTTTGLSRHAFWDYWPAIKAVRKDPQLRTMFEIVDDVPTLVADTVNVLPPDGAPWDKPIDVVRARAANRESSMPLPPDLDLARDAERLAAEEHKAALGREPKPKAAEPAFEKGEPFEGKAAPEPPKAPQAKPAEKPAPPFAERMRAAREVKAAKK